MQNKTWDFDKLGLIPYEEFDFETMRKRYNIKEKEKTLVSFEGKDYTAKELSELPYFCYGSNLLKTQMEQRCPGSSPLIKATLNGYKLIFRIVADITKDKNSSVPGALYSMTEDDIISLNRFEGFPYKYKIEIGRVKIRQDKTVLCFWYEIKNKRNHKTQEPKIDYLSKIVLGYSQWGLNEQPILESIKRVQNSVRQRKRRKVLEQMLKLQQKYMQIKSYNI